MMMMMMQEHHRHRDIRFISVNIQQLVHSYSHLIHVCCQFSVAAFLANAVTLLVSTWTVCLHATYTVNITCTIRGLKADRRLDVVPCNINMGKRLLNVTENY